MSKTVTMRITFIRAAVLAVSAVVALLPSGRCEASCGEYVYSRYRTLTHKVPDIRRNDSPDDPDVLKTGLLRSTEERGVSRETIPVSPVPCNGPGCRQSPAPSLPVAPQTTIESSDQDRLLSGQRDIELPSHVSHRRDLKDLARALRGFPLMIDMPPETVGGEPTCFVSPDC